MDKTKTMGRRLWELVQCWWILPTFALGLFPWLSFFYIGFRARQRKWIIAGAIYSILPVTMFLTVENPIFKSPVGQVITWSVILAGVVSIVHAFKVRREYLLRLDVLNEIRESGREEQVLRERFAREYDVTTLPAAGGSTAVGAGPIEGEPAGTGSNTVSPVGQPPLAGTAPLPPSPIDLNSADEQSLASLPGITIILAKRAISLRQTRNGFQSVDDFGQALGLKPHMVERIRPLVTVRPPGRPERIGPVGRVVDY